MYELGESDTDYSYEYSDVEYNTLDPYDYELNDFTMNRNTIETPEEKLFSYIEDLDLEGVRSVLPGLIELQEETKICNGDTNVNEDGDVPSESSSDDSNEEDDDDIIDRPLNIKVKDIILKGGVTPLMLAVTSANAPLVEYILSLGIDVNYSEKNSNNCALLSLTSHVCADWGLMNNNWHIDAPKCLKILIDAGANVKIKGFLTTQESGFTALHYAARNNYWEMLKLLIQAGADIDVMNNQRETALMLAATRGHVMCCNILLLAGANAQLMDRGGSNAAYIAGIENHKILSDAISVFSGSAQHNVELYKIWSQYILKGNSSDSNDYQQPDISDNISNTCIESFCLALDAPYLAIIMRDQGVTLNDLKLISYSKLKEMGVSSEDCDKIMNAMQDFKKNINGKNARISFEYGKPLRLVTMLEIVGNITEHLELVDTNLGCWYSHLSKKYQIDMVLYKSTMGRLQATTHDCMRRTNSVIEKLEKLKDLCDGKIDGISISKPTMTEVKDDGSSRLLSLPRISVVAASLLAVTVSVAFISSKYTH